MKKRSEKKPQLAIIAMVLVILFSGAIPASIGLKRAVCNVSNEKLRG